MTLALYPQPPHESSGLLVTLKCVIINHSYITFILCIFILVSSLVNQAFRLVWCVILTILQRGFWDLLVPEEW